MMKWVIELLEKVLTELLERIAPKLEKLFTDLLEKVLPNLEWRFFSKFEIAVLQEVGVAVFLALLIAAAPICAVIAAHLALRGRRARVFISFQHERESIADTLVLKLTESGIKPLKLQFVQDPKH